MTTTASGGLSALLVVLAVLAVPRAGSAARVRLRRLTAESRTAPGRRGAGPRAGLRRAGVARHCDVVALAEHLAGALRAGLAPSRAWGTLAARPGPAHAVSRGTAKAVLPWLELGVPTGRALWEATRPTAGSPLVPLVVALDVCDRTGAPTAEVLDGLAAALRAEDAAAHETALALAAPRATVRVMTAMPAVGLGMAALLGTDVVHVLVGTTAGRLCVAVGGGFWAAGHWWIRRLVRAAGASGRASSSEKAPGWKAAGRVWR